MNVPLNSQNHAFDTSAYALSDAPVHQSHAASADYGNKESDHKKIGQSPTSVTDLLSPYGHRLGQIGFGEAALSAASPKPIGCTQARSATFRKVWLWSVVGVVPAVLGLFMMAPAAIAQSSSAPTPSSTQQPEIATHRFVNPTTGNDRSGDGSSRSPFRTLTHALDRAQPGMTIVLAPGTYSVETGEQFPIRLKPGVTVYGDPSTQGEGIVIRGGGEFISPTATRQNIAILGADQAVVTGVTVTNPNARGYGIWIESSSLTVVDNTLTGNQHDGVSVNGTSDPLIQRNRFYQNGANGITVFGRSQPRIQQNIFDQTGYGVNVGDAAAPILISNRIVNNRSGVVAQEQSRPVMRHNIIENNQQSGVVAIAQAQPDLGTPREPGNNQFANNGDYAINAEVADHPVLAAGNQIDETHIIGAVDFGGQDGTMLSRTPSPLTVNTASISAPSPAPALSAIPNTPLSATNAVPMPEMNAPDLIERITRSSANTLNDTQDHAAVIPHTPLSAANATPMVPTQLPTQLLPQPISEPAPVLSPSPTPLTATFPRPTVTTAQASRGGPGQDALAIDEFVSPQRPSSATPATRSTPPSLRSLLATVQHRQPQRQALLPTTTDEPVEIQVIEPEPASSSTAQRTLRSPLNRNPFSLNRLTHAPLAQQSSLSESSGAIPIRVIEPPTASSQAREASEVPTARINHVAVTPREPSADVTRQSARSPQDARFQRNSNILPVPQAEVPYGHVGNMARVNVGENPLNQRILPGASRVRRLGLRYRVVADAQGQHVASIVRAIAPEAFQTWQNGRSLIQVGAFASLENANEIARRLARQGVRVEIQTME